MIQRFQKLCSIYSNYKILAIFPVVQYILVAYFVCNSLYLLIPHLCLAFPLFLLTTCSLFSTSVILFPFCYIH